MSSCALHVRCKPCRWPAAQVSGAQRRGGQLAWTRLEAQHGVVLDALLAVPRHSVVRAAQLHLCRTQVLLAGAPAVRVLRSRARQQANEGEASSRCAHRGRALGVHAAGDLGGGDMCQRCEHELCRRSKLRGTGGLLRCASGQAARPRDAPDTSPLVRLRGLPQARQLTHQLRPHEARTAARLPAPPAQSCRAGPCRAATADQKHPWCQPRSTTRQHELQSGAGPRRGGGGGCDA